MVEEHTTSKEIDEIFEGLFDSLDDIDNQIHENGIQIVEHKYQNLEQNLNDISISLNKIEKKLKISFFYKLKKYSLRLNPRKMSFTR